MAKSRDKGINPNNTMSLQEAKKVKAVYTEAYNEMNREISKRLTTGLASDNWRYQKLSELARLNQELEYIIRQAEKQSKPLINSGTLQLFTAGVEETDKILKDLNYVPDFDVPSMSIDRRKVQVLANQTQVYLYNKNGLMLQSASRQYVNAINQVNSLMATGTITRATAVTKFLMQQTPGAKFRDRQGRQWRMDAYADMAVRTGYVQANLAGSVDRMKEYGLYQVTVSSHAGACPLCRPWEGEVLDVIE